MNNWSFFCYSDGFSPPKHNCSYCGWNYQSHSEFDLLHLSMDKVQNKKLPMFLSQKTQTCESSHAELRVVLIGGEVLLCFLFGFLTLECVYQAHIWVWLTGHPPHAQASWCPGWQWRSGTTFPRETSSTAGRHWVWVPALCRMCRCSSLFPSSHRFHPSGIIQQCLWPNF